MDMKSVMPWGRDRRLTPPSHNAEQPNPFLGLHRQVDRLFDDFLRDFDRPTTSHAGWSSWPSVEVRETDNRVHVIAELPGMDEKDVEVTYREGLLTLKGEKKAETNGAVYSERWHGAFERSLQLGPEMEATFKQGVLTISLAKKPESMSAVKRIPINKAS